MRVATFNILHGRSLSDGRVDVDRFADAVASLDADVLALQEVDRGQKRSQGADLTAVAAEAMGAPEHRFVPAFRGGPSDWAPAGDDDPSSGPAYGVALLSRHPVSAWQVVRLPRWRGRAPYWSGGGVLPSWVKEEPRVAVVATVETPSGPWAVAGTHLSFVPWWNGRQLEEVVRALRGHEKTPRLLLGDLNMGPGKAQRITGMSGLVTASTFPANAPRLQLDHVLTDGALPLRAGEARRLPVSDHRALVVDLE